jgi:hypothetical protein
VILDVPLLRTPKSGMSANAALTPILALGLRMTTTADDENQENRVAA